MSPTKRRNDSEPEGSSQVSKKPRAIFVPDFLSQDLLHITVGAEDKAKEYKIHKNLLCHISPFFAGAANGDFIEAVSDTIALPEDVPAAFDIFIHWAYSDKILADPETDTNNPEVYLHAIVLADKLLVPDLVEMCWTRLRRSFSVTKFPEPEFIDTLYGLDPDVDLVSKLRDYFVNVVGYFIQSSKSCLDDCDTVVDGNKEFAVDVLGNILGRTQQQIRSNRYYDTTDSHPFFSELYMTASSEQTPDATDVQTRNDMEEVIYRYRRAMSHKKLSNFDLEFKNWTLNTPSKEQMMKAGWCNEDSYSRNDNNAKCVLCHRKHDGKKPATAGHTSNCLFNRLRAAGLEVPLFGECRGFGIAEYI